MHTFRTAAPRTPRWMRWALISAVAGAAATATAAPVWISLDRAALAVVQRSGVAVSHIERHPMRVMQRLPGAADRAMSSFAVGDDETVIAQVDEAEMEKALPALHEELRRCGGHLQHRSLAAARAAEARTRAMADGGAAGPQRASPTAMNYAMDDQAEVEPRLPLASEANIRAFIEWAASRRTRSYRSPTGIAFSGDLAARWTQMAKGRSDVSVAYFNHAGIAQRSVIMTIQGRSKPDEIVVIGSHMDSVNWNAKHPQRARAPGADDNASGLATTTEIARVLIESGYRPERTLQFMAYAKEEVGHFSSMDIVNSYRAAGRNVVGALNFDMTNYRMLDEDIVIVADYTDRAQNQFMIDLIRTYQPGIVIGGQICGHSCSDHQSWTAGGYAASYAFEAFTDNPKIHTKHDTLDNCGGTADHSVPFAKLGVSYAVELGSH